MRENVKNERGAGYGENTDISEFLPKRMSSQGSDSDVSDSEDDPENQSRISARLGSSEQSEIDRENSFKRTRSRLDLELVKVEEVADLRTPLLFHQYVEKTIEEVKTQEELRAQKEQLKIKRRKEQEEREEERKREKERKERNAEEETEAAEGEKERRRGRRRRLAGRAREGVQRGRRVRRRREEEEEEEDIGKEKSG